MLAYIDTGGGIGVGKFPPSPNLGKSRLGVRGGKRKKRGRKGKIEREKEKKGKGRKKKRKEREEKEEKIVNQRYF